jgi:hypothetical protein
MSATCQGEECTLAPEAEDVLCLLHSKRDDKERAELLQAFNQLDRDGVIRIYGAHLRGADMHGITLTGKNLRESDLTGVCFEDARFDRVGFDGSTLDDVNFEGAILQRCDLRRVVSLQRCKWYETILDGVRMPGFRDLGLECTYLDGPEPDRAKAQYVFRTFKELYKRDGDQDGSGLFYEREMDMKRALSKGTERLWYDALWALCGYGERPIRTIGAFLLCIFTYAIAYTFLNVIGPNGPIGGDFWEALYFSTVTFTTLGYGDMRPDGLARIFASTEALLGIFTISLFIFVFCRRMVR